MHVPAWSPCAEGSTAPSTHPELIHKHAPERVRLVVADALRDEGDRALVAERDARSRIGELPVGRRPELASGFGIERLLWSIRSRR